MQAGRVGEKETSKYNRNGLAAALLKYRRFKTMISKNGNNEIKTLSHSTYRCQYHIVFAPKYRRQVIYKDIEYYGSNVPLFRRNGYRQSGTMIP